MRATCGGMTLIRVLGAAVLAVSSGACGDAAGVRAAGPGATTRSDASAGVTASQWVVTETDLGTLGGSYSAALDINESGHIVGWAQLPDLTEHAFLWTESGGMRDLGTLGGSRSHALGISNAGHVVGNSTTSTGEDHAFLWTEANGMQDLGTLGGDFSIAWGQVNSSGQVAGTSKDANGDERPFLWTAQTGMQDIASPAFPHAQPADINEAGMVVGHYFESSAVLTAYRSRNGSYQSLGTMGGVFSLATAVSKEAVVGNITMSQTFLSRAFIWWRPGHYRLLQLLPTGRANAAGGVNDANDVVGSANVLVTPPVRTHAVLWSNATGAPIDLTPTGRRALAFAINANREIVGHRDLSAAACCLTRATRWTVSEIP